MNRVLGSGAEPPGKDGTEAGSAPTGPVAGAGGRRLEVSAEMWSILLVGAALATLTLNGMGGIREDMRGLREDMRERFSAVEGRLTSIDGRLGTVEREQGEVRGILSAMDGRFTKLEERLTAVERGQVQIQVTLSAMDGRLTAVERGQEDIRGIVEGLRDAVADQPSAAGG